jgi:hypothetical protein
VEEEKERKKKKSKLGKQKKIATRVGIQNRSISFFLLDSDDYQELNREKNERKKKEKRKRKEREKKEKSK